MIGKKQNGISNVNNIQLPVRHSTEPSIRRKVIGISIFIAFASIVYGVTSLFGSPVTVNKVIVSAMMVLVFGGSVALYYGFRLSRPKYCKICNLREIFISKYCPACIPVILKMLQSSNDPIICRLCDDEMLNYNNYVIHFHKKHNNGCEYNNDPMGGAKYYKKYHLQDNAIRKII